ncbi:protein EARLY FLOWERING 5-like [Zingiber officinale]|uniref:protein EARLY FLOWERING 5-like n=1 Tax=Zingiber officinale TaxID=94328 RepID=UPI001C4A9D37|nr:protein EARLY FLOWERING 5-like [Zingiber officinale]
MKTTKGGKVMNPTDAYRKEIRKKELKRNKKERKKVREVGILKKDPEAIREQIEKLERMKADGALDKARKHKKRQLEDTLNLVMKKRKEYEDKMREKGETPVMFSHLGPPRRRAATEEEERARNPRPEDSVYYHPTLNPTGAPPPGKPPMYKSSIGPRISSAASGTAASSSATETDEALTVLPPPPPPPLPSADGVTSHDDSVVPPSIPLPPPPPIPPKHIANVGASLPPPPPPGPPPKDQAAVPTPLPILPPPPPQPLLQPPPPGTSAKEADKTTGSDGPALKEPNKVTPMHPPPPPPPGLPPKSANQQSDPMPSEFVPGNAPSSNDNSTTRLMPPPLRQPPPVVHNIPLINSLPLDMMPPGMVHFPTDMRPPLMVPGFATRPPPPPPPGIVPPQMLRSMFAAPPGPLPFPRPSGFPIPHEDDFDAFRPSAPQKPSYVKSAASTVVKRPLAQHNPELTAMVPASVRVRRETVAPKLKAKSQLTTTPAISKPSGLTFTGKPETATTSGAKSQSIDDSYMAFLEDMKALGALDC